MAARVYAAHGSSGAAIHTEPMVFKSFTEGATVTQSTFQSGRSLPVVEGKTTCGSARAMRLALLIGRSNGSCTEMFSWGGGGEGGEGREVRERV